MVVDSMLKETRGLRDAICGAAAVVLWMISALAPLSVLLHLTRYNAHEEERNRRRKEKGKKERKTGSARYGEEEKQGISEE